jgi:hypothetical protein
MQDTPDHTEILAAVAVLLRETIMPLLSGHPNYQVRVAANALDLVGRQIKLQPGYDAEELASLKSLLGAEGTLEDLNRILCERIETHALTLDSPGVAEHLWATTMAKMAVDQPGYARYQRELAG